MAPLGKRKRGYNQELNDSASRPSPYRPDVQGGGQQNSNEQQSNSYNAGFSNIQYGGRGGRRPSRGGRGGHSGYGTPAAVDGPNQGTPRDSVVQAVEISDSVATARQARFGQHSLGSGTQTPSVSTHIQTPDVIAPINSAEMHVESSTAITNGITKMFPVYDYEYLTSERLSKWTERGRDEVTTQTLHACLQSDISVLSTVFQELLRAGLDGHIRATDAGKCVEEILAQIQAGSVIDGPALFLDTISVLRDVDTSNAHLLELVQSTGISPDLMREQLDDTVLKLLGLVRQTFDKVFIRKQTGILYRQSNYNLLREESEGYSKLVTELFTTTDNEPPTAEVAENTFENMHALIGAFDLDPGRVLDVTLDVFASLLVKHFRFFVKLLRASSWWCQDAVEEFTGNSETGPSGLPPWAEPGHSSWTFSEEERHLANSRKEQRDVQFWNHAKTVGMDAFFTLGGRRLINASEVADHLSSAEQNEQLTAAEVAETESWIKSTRTLPPSGNAVAAQLLGFKLRFYASAARDASDTLPMNLIYLAALLIKIGFISLRDLYTHLNPGDDSMDAVKEKQMKEKEEREIAKRPGGGSLNALARAGALADDTLPPPSMGRLREGETRPGTPSRFDAPASKAASPSVKGEDEEKENLPEPSDQKVQLLRSLLCIGALPEALYLLGRFTWLPDAFADLPEHIHRILHHSLSKLYDPLCPLQDREGVRTAARVPSHDQSGLPKGELRLVEQPLPKVLRWAQLDKNDAHEGIDYRFYWDDWSDNVPVCQNVDDVFTLCSTLVNYSGVKIGQDIPLLMKLVRIGKHSLAQDFSPVNRDRWYDLCKRLLCPALSMTKANPAVVNEVFDILKLYPTQARYSVYAEWFGGQTSRIPDISDAFELVRLETKDLLKRMSKNNMKAMARTLAKMACASPGIAFAVVLTQIESYNNFIDVVIECGRYFTYMGYDVLTWSVLNTLGRAGRSRAAQNGVNTSRWLLSLSTFCGRVFKRYSVMNTLPVLQYVLEQLHESNFRDLRVLREMITSMSGIAPDTDFTDAQVQAMAGGELLQAQTLRQLLDKRHESKASSRRLMKTLVDYGLTAPLLIAIAQQRQMCTYGPELELKIISESFDDIHIVLSQYLEMIQNGVPVDDFESLIPDLVTLISQYGIDPSIAFSIHRKCIARAIGRYDATHEGSSKVSRRRSSTVKVFGNGDLAMIEGKPSTIETTPTPPDTTAVAIELLQEVDGDKEMVDIDEALAPIGGAFTSADISPISKASSFRPWHPVLHDLIDKLRHILPDQVVSNVSLPFYVTFWQLSLPDLMAPYKSYTEEDSRQKEKIAAINADRSDLSNTGMKRKEQQKKEITEFQQKLVEEMKLHLTNYSHIRERLEVEKKYWFKDFSGKWLTLSEAILQECFLPRLLLSPLDSYFTWKMLNMLHSSGTPEFRTMFFLDRILSEKMLTNVIFQCTGREAENLGRFINEVLRELSSWHADRSIYEKRAYGMKKELPGFAQKVTKDGVLERFLEYEDFRRLLYKWHRNLLEALKTCMTTTEWKHIMNAIILSRSVYRYYPAVNWMGQAMCSFADKIAKAESVKLPMEQRTDLWVAATSLLGSLNSRQKQWVLPQAFYLSDAATKSQRASSRSTSAAPISPMPDPARSESGASSSRLLNPEATAFVTNTNNASSVDAKSSTSGKVEVEDGELEDGEAADLKVPVTLTTIPVAEAVTPAPTASPIGDLKSRALATIAAKRQQMTTSASSKPPADPRTASTGITTSGSQVQTTPMSSARDRVLVPRDDGLSTPGSRTPQATHQVPVRPEASRAASASGDRTTHNLPTRPQAQPSHRDGRLPQRPEADQSIPPSNGLTTGRPSELQGQVQVRSNRPADPFQSRMDERQSEVPNRLNNTSYNERMHDPPVPGRDPGYLNERSGAPYPAAAHERGSHREANRPQRSLPPGRLPVEQYGGAESRVSGPSRADANAYIPQNHLQPPLQVVREQDRAITINPARAALLREPVSQIVPSRQGGLHDHNVREDRFSRSQALDPNESRQIRGFPNHGEHPSNRIDHIPTSSPAAYDARVPPSSRQQAYDAEMRGIPQPHLGHAGTEPSRSMESGTMQQYSRDAQDTNYGRNPEHSRRGQTRYQDVNYGRLDPVPMSPPLGQNSSQTRIASGQSGVLDKRPHYSGSIAPTASVEDATDRVLRGNPTAIRQEWSNSQEATSQVSALPTPLEQPPDTFGIHPSRLQQFGPKQPPPIQTSAQPHQQPPLSAASMPPSGPRSNQARPLQNEIPTASPIAQSPSVTRGPPLGPGSAVPDRRSGARRFAGLNDALQKGGVPVPAPPVASLENSTNNDRGASIRGRAAANSLHEDMRAMGASQMPPPSTNNGRQAEFGRIGPPPVSQLGHNHLSSQPQQARSQASSVSERESEYGRLSGAYSRNEKQPHESGENTRHRSSREGTRDTAPTRGTDRETRSTRGGTSGQDDARPRELRDRDLSREFRSRQDPEGSGRDRERERLHNRDDAAAPPSVSNSRGYRGRDANVDDSTASAKDRERGDREEGRERRDTRSSTRGHDYVDEDHGYHLRRGAPGPNGMDGASGPMQSVRARDGPHMGGARMGGFNGGGGDVRKRPWGGDQAGMASGDSKRPRRGEM